MQLRTVWCLQFWLGCLRSCLVAGKKSGLRWVRGEGQRRKRGWKLRLRLVLLLLLLMLLLLMLLLMTTTTMCRCILKSYALCCTEDCQEA